MEDVPGTVRMHLPGLYDNKRRMSQRSCFGGPLQRQPGMRVRRDSDDDCARGWFPIVGYDDDRTRGVVEHETSRVSEVWGVTAEHKQVGWMAEQHGGRAALLCT